MSSNLARLNGRRIARDRLLQIFQIRRTDGHAITIRIAVLNNTHKKMKLNEPLFKLNSTLPRAAVVNLSSLLNVGEMTVESQRLRDASARRTYKTVATI